MTVRRDLLALTPDDLADLATRGHVKRAQREIERGKADFALEVSPDGEVTVRWDAGVVTVIGADSTPKNAMCDCQATGICKHIVRAVLLYQQGYADAQDSEPAAPTAPWDPGALADEVVHAACSAATVRNASQAWHDGLVVELLRGVRPVARFHVLRHTVRFLVPNDLRYAQCDCAASSACLHVPLAVWAFREMSKDQHAAVISTGHWKRNEVRGQSVLDATDAAIRALVGSGVGHAPSERMDRLAAHETALQDVGAVWPAAIVHELRAQYDHYRSHDARFNADELGSLVGELTIRLDALRARDLPIPRLFVSGQSGDDTTQLGKAPLVGLGCSVRLRRNGAEVAAMLLDAYSGTICAVRRFFPDEEESETQDDRVAPDFSQLARRLVVTGRDLATIGASHVVVKTAKLQSDHQLLLRRSNASVYGQQYQWEQLPTPVRADRFNDIHARLSHRPPACLRPRRAGENLHVCQIAEVRDVRFDPADQSVRATLIDQDGAPALLRHPYTSRGKHGTERLLQWLTDRPDALRFVSGMFRVSAHGLIGAPIGLVFDHLDARVLVQPWVDDMDAFVETSTVTLSPPRSSLLPLVRLQLDVVRAAGDAVLQGPDTTTDDSRWNKLEHACQILQLTAIADAIGALRRARDAESFGAAAMQLAALTTLWTELGR